MNLPNTVAVISSFHPEQRLIESAEALARNGVTATIIIDDGSDPDHENLVLQRLEQMPKVTVVRNDSNSGIAYALNQGIRRAFHLPDVAAVLTMDQDSIIPEGYLNAAWHLHDEATAAGLRVGVIAPQYLGDTPFPVDHGFNDDFVHLFDPIQSGALIPRSTIDNIGLLREDFFIDSVDSEFNYRCLTARLALLAVPGTHMNHELGVPQPIMIFGRHLSLLGKKRFYIQHSPMRTYYIVRNSIVLYHEYRSALGAHARRRSRTDIPALMMTLLLGNHRKQHLRALRQGIRDAHRRRMGHIPDDLLRQL